MIIYFTLVVVLFLPAWWCANTIPRVNDSVMGNNLVGEIYKLDEYLGAGGYGLIYGAHHIDTKIIVAIKLELNNIKRPRLKREATVYQRFNGTAGFPEFYWYGDFDIYKALVIERLGPNLKQKMAQSGGQKSRVRIISELVPQMIRRLQVIHTNNFLHHDISPGNFVMGRRNGQTQTVYLIDFGSALYHRPGRSSLYTADRSRHVKTRTYCSVGAMLGHDYTPIDDMIALGYTFVGLTVGLPWGSSTDSTELLQMKMDTTTEDLCDGLPRWCAKYFSHLDRVTVREGSSLDYSHLYQAFNIAVEQENTAVMSGPFRHWFWKKDDTNTIPR